MNHSTVKPPQSDQNTPTAQTGTSWSRDIQLGTVIGIGALLLLALMLAWRVRPAAILQESYWLMLHPLLETFSVMVSLLIFMTGWYFQSRRQNPQLLLIAAVFLTVGLIDYAHILSYRGMPNPYAANSQQTLVFSMAARFFVAIGLLLAILQTPKRTTRFFVRYIYLAGALGLTGFVYWIVLFHPAVIPDLHYSGQGPTPFYLVAQTLLLVVYVATGVALYIRRRNEYPFATKELFVSIGLLLISEIFFTRYVLINDFFNIAAHVLKVIAYGFLHQAIFVDNVKMAIRRLYRTERRLKLNRKWLYTTLHSIGDAVIATDEEGRIQFMNPVAERLTGWSEEEARGHKVTEVFRIINEQTRQPAESPVDKVLREGIVVGLANHTLLLTKDGAEIPIDDSAAPIRTDNGDVQGVVLVFRDVSERNQREKEQQRLLAILEETTDFVSTADAHGRTLYLNRAGRRMLGIEDEAKLTDLSIPKGHPPEMARKMIEEILPAAAQNGIWSGEAVLLSNDGREIPVHQVIIAHKGVGGEVEYYSTVARDLTDLKKSQENERLAAKIFASISEGIVVTDTNDKIVTTNPAFTALTGYTEAEAVGKSPLQLLALNTQPETVEQMLAAVRRTGQWRGELQGRRKNGELYYEELSVSTVKDETGTVTHYVGVLKDITERKKLESQIQFMAYHDALTGLPNRIFFLDRLKQAIAAAKRNRQQLAVMFLALDRFKFINDTLGHTVGDILLKQVAVRLSQCLGENDTVSRLGGDEFILLLYPSDGPTAAKTAEKILSAFTEPFVLEGQEYAITPSIGISMYPDDGDHVDKLIRHADTAMYEAKEKRNAYRFFHSSMNVYTAERLKLENELRKGLKQQEFFLHYQPKLDLRTGTIIGVEALVRWQHPELGVVYPNKFITVAEESGLILPLSEYVLRAACRQAKQWRQEGLTTVRVAVNLSMAQLYQSNLRKVVEDVLQEFNLPATCLELEVTETMVMQQPDRTIQILRDLKAMGIHISLDDFGTGYSSLSYLQQLPLDSIKVDRSFMRNFQKDSDNYAIVKAAIELTHNLKMSVIVEGVETEEQLEMLRQLNCDAIQGYLLSPPVPPQTIAEMLRHPAEFLPTQYK